MGKLIKIAPVEIKEVLTVLAESPRKIVRLTKGFDNLRLCFRPDRKAWSANDILAHLRSCADVWGDNIKQMIEKDKPTLPDIHPRKWIKTTNYLTLEFHPSFQGFKVKRKELLSLLRGISFEDWSRSAMIGRREHTVFSQARRMAKHEQVHWVEIEYLLK